MSKVANRSSKSVHKASKKHAKKSVKSRIVKKKSPKTGHRAKISKGKGSKKSKKGVARKINARIRVTSLTSRALPR